MPVTPDTNTDYTVVDGLETITLTRTTDGTSESVTVENCKRSRVSATMQLTGLQPDAVVWDLPVVEMADLDITEPAAGDVITDSNSNKFVIIAVPTYSISQIYGCLTRAGA